VSEEERAFNQGLENSDDAMDAGQDFGGMENSFVNFPEIFFFVVPRLRQ